MARRIDGKRQWFSVSKVARRLGLLQPAPKVVVVGGTNGKGTTVNYLQNLLIEKGVVVGSTYSPHLQRYNERILVNGQAVSDDEIVAAFEVLSAEQGEVVLSYHDYATLASFWIFKQRKVDIALLEVGVGGRYDATNVVFRDINVITSIALDHQDMLGSTRESIGWEKAGICRSEVPLIYGDLDLVSTVAGRAYALHCPLLRRGRDFDYALHNYQLCSIATQEDEKMHQHRICTVPKYPLSFTLAVQVLTTLGYRVSESELTAIAPSQTPGRMELMHYQNRDWLLDVAHNPEAITYLLNTLPRLTDKKVARVLLGTLKNKDFLGIMDALSLPSDQILVTNTQGWRGTTWKEQCASLGIQCVDGIDFAFQELVASTVTGDLILVVGSFDIVGRFRAKMAS